MSGMHAKVIDIMLHMGDASGAIDYISGLSRPEQAEALNRHGAQLIRDWGMEMKVRPTPACPWYSCKIPSMCVCRLPHTVCVSLEADESRSSLGSHALEGGLCALSRHCPCTVSRSVPCSRLQPGAFQACRHVSVVQYASAGSWVQSAVTAYYAARDVLARSGGGGT